MRADGAPSSCAVARVIALGSGTWAATASWYQRVNSGNGTLSAASSSSGANSCMALKKIGELEKKCPAVEFFGVAQSPKSSSSGTLKMIHGCRPLASGFPREKQKFLIFAVSIKQIYLKQLHKPQLLSNLLFPEA